MTHSPADVDAGTPYVQVPRRTRSGRTATSTVVASLGVLASFAAVEHGVGEVLQGRGVPESLVIESWPDSPAFSALSGEPALTVLPDLVLAGVSTIAVAVAVGVYVVGFAHRRHGSIGLLGLAILLLLVGGGFGPPLLLVILAVASMRPVAAQGAPGLFRRRIADRWSLLLVITVSAYLGLFPGTVLLHSFAGVNSATLVTVLTVTAFAGLLLTLAAARTHDRLRRLEN